MKKILISFLTLIMCLFAVLGVNTKAEANGETTETTETFKISLVDGAQIRLEEPYGIKFIGQVTEGTPAEGATYGIVLGKGIHTNLTHDTNLAVSAEVTSTTEDGEFYVTMVNIPKSMHTLYITARGYVKEGNKITYSENHVVRSLYGVAEAYKESQGTDYVENAIIEEILNVTDKNVTYNINGGNFEYKTRKAMVDAFIADLTTYCNPTSPIVVEDFFASSQPNSTKIFEFVDTDTKWNWVLKYINEVRVANHKHVLASTGDHADKTSEIRGELHNFLNQTGNGNDKGHAMYGCDYSSIEVSEGFWKEPYFKQTATETEKILSLANKPFYQFEGWYTNPECTGEQVYVLTGDITVYAKWSQKVNDINYVLNNENASSAHLDKGFKATDYFYLGIPEYDETSQTFLGWYLEPTFETKYEQIELYTEDDLTVYAKWANEHSYNVNLDFNGGNLYWDSKEDIVADLITDFNVFLHEKAFVPLNADGSYKYATDGSNMYNSDPSKNYSLEVSTWAQFFQDTQYKVKWSWLVDYLFNVANDDASESIKTGMNKFQDVIARGAGQFANDEERTNANYAISNQVRAFIRGVKFEHAAAGLTTSNFADAAVVNKVFGYTDWYNKNMTFLASDSFPTPVKPGCSFIGWFKDSTCTIKLNSAADLTDEITTIYAGWAPYTITYMSVQWNTREEMVDDFLDYAMQICGVTSKPDGMVQGTGDTTVGFANVFTTSNISPLITAMSNKNNEWYWLRTYILDTVESNGYTIMHGNLTSSDLNTYAVFWRYHLGAFLFEEYRDSYPVTLDYRKVNGEYCDIAIGYESLPTYNAANVELLKTHTISTPTTTVLMTPTRTGYTFEGWYLDTDYTIQVTEANADITVYAKWRKNA